MSAGRWSAALVTAVVALVGSRLFAEGDSGLLDRAEYYIYNYNLDSSYLDSAWVLISDVRGTSPDDERSLCLAAQLRVTQADYAPGRADSLRCFEDARAFAETLKTLNDSNACGHLWYAVAAGGLAEMRGILNSVEIVPVLKREFERALELGPDYPEAYECLGRFYFDLPSAMGGSTGRAIEYYQSGLRVAPDYALLRLELARAYTRERQTNEAIAQLDSLLATENPWPPADFELNDRPEAEKLLARLKAGN